MNRMQLAQRVLAQLAASRRFYRDAPHAPDEFEGYDAERALNELGEAVFTQATPYALDGDLTDVLEFVMVTLPDFVLSPMDPRTPAGVAVFDRPIVTPRVAAAKAEGRWHDGVDGIAAVSWWPATADQLPSERENGDRGVVFGMHLADVLSDDDPPNALIVTEYAAFGGALVHCWDIVENWRYGTPWNPVPDGEHTGAQLAAALFRLLRQRVAVPHEEWMPRQARRAAQRLNLSNLALWTLRESQQGENGEQGSGSALDHRHIVSAHWKQQWYPSEQRHAPILIDAYVRGPKDAPLIVRQRVGVVIR